VFHRIVSSSFIARCGESRAEPPAPQLRYRARPVEEPGEAYHQWNSSLPGYVQPNAELGRPFESADLLRDRFRKAWETRERLRGEMIALQEEMDWLVYAAYGRLPEDHAAVCSAAALECGSEATALQPASLLAENHGVTTPPQQAAAQESGSKLPHSITPLDREE
jgi:hypothetical protein